MMNLGLVADAVAYGACTAPLLAMISPLLKKLGALCVEGRAETPWQAALECAIPFGRSGHRAKTPREQVEHVLECVAFYVDADAIPAAFKERAPDHMKAAAKLLRTLRVTTIRADVQPPAGRRGRMLTPWGAVQAFAQCFGIRVPDARQVRRRKSN